MQPFLEFVIGTIAALFPVVDPVGIGLIGLSVFLSLRSSRLLLKWLGAGGIHALSRLLGLFVMAIGGQLILNGLANWLDSLNIIL